MSADGDSPAACAGLGIAYVEGRGVAKDLDKGNALFEKTCAKGGSAACYGLAESYTKGRGVKKDAVRAAEFYAKACDGDAGGACTDLARMYEHGDGIPADRTKARAYYKRGCQGGDAAACSALELLRRALALTAPGRAASPFGSVIPTSRKPAPHRDVHRRDEVVVRDRVAARAVRRDLDVLGVGEVRRRLLRAQRGLEGVPVVAGRGLRDARELVDAGHANPQIVESTSTESCGGEWIRLAASGSCRWSSSGSGRCSPTPR